MAADEAPCNSLSPPSEEDFIDMEVTSSSSSSSSSSSNFFCYSNNGSPPESRDFEFQFQMTSFSDQNEPENSPADELFYKGKLLPLLLPPRLQMVQKLLQSSSSNNGGAKEDSFSESFEIPFVSLNAPLESCNTSPTESCRPSCELNPDEYLFGWKREINGFSQEPPRKSWSKKLKKMKQSSRAYLKALFGKSGCSCSDRFCAGAVYNEESETVSNGRSECSGKYSKIAEKNPFGITDYNKWQMPNDDFGGIINNHRKSFSGAIQRPSATKSSSSSTSSSGSSSLSSSFSFSSNGLSDLQFFKRSISANSGFESSIEGAIAHCKKSQQLFDPRKTESKSSSSMVLDQKKIQESCSI